MTARTSYWHRMLDSSAPPATVLVRIAVGVVFVGEGVQKFLYPDALGAGRFTKIGIPAPGVMGPFVGAVELVCGALLLVGLLTRLAAVPLIIDMIVAIVSTKIPILIGHGFLGFADPAGKNFGLLAMLHEARTDLSMLLALIFLWRVGAGPASLDELVRPRARTSPGR